jgi:hypothetical protein
VLAIALAASTHAAAQGLTIGLVSDGACGSPHDILEHDGELYAVKLNGQSHDDWQLDASAKDGPQAGLANGESVGSSRPLSASGKSQLRPVPRGMRS